MSSPLTPRTLSLRSIVSIDTGSVGAFARDITQETLGFVLRGIAATLGASAAQSRVIEPPTKLALQFAPSKGTTSNVN